MRFLIPAARAVFALLFFQYLTDASHWVLIVVGSRRFWNYRHQADACHAYHTVRKHGIPQERIILMMYDDVANDPNNPFPGTLYNQPSIKDSTGTIIDPENVYEGCNVDYSGDTVTPQNFINVLLGNRNLTNGKRVLNSTSEDRIFVNFVDHGADEYVVFPRTQKLTLQQLRDTLLQMQRLEKYKELVFYMEACHAGSMFYNVLSEHENVFASTAANRHESSWATYCPPYDVVRNQSIGTCLGDLYSVNWMTDSDRMNPFNETLLTQYETVKRETTKSHVRAFGSTSIEREDVSNFQSGDAISVSNQIHVEEIQGLCKVQSSVKAYDAELIGMFYRYLRTSAFASRRDTGQELMFAMQQRIIADDIFLALKSASNGKVSALMQNKDCVQKAVEQFEEQCQGLGDAELGGAFTSYSLQYTETFHELCASEPSWNSVQLRIRSACSRGRRLHSFLSVQNQAVI